MSALPIQAAAQAPGQAGRAATIVRSARADERAAIAALLIDGNREYRAVLPTRIFHGYMQNLRALIAEAATQESDGHSGSELMVAELNGHLLGAVTFFPDASREGWDLPKDWAGMRALVVEPTARGRGIGRQLAEACILRAWRLGAAACCLHTSAFHKTARRLYAGMGFARCPEHDISVGDLLPDARGETFAIEAFRLDLKA